MTELLDEIRVGIRTIVGTEWPVVDQLWCSGKAWLVVRELCNGVPRGSEEYSSELAAREAFGSRLEGRKPRAQAPATERIAVRATSAELAAWRTAAAAEGRSVSEWLRAAAELALARGSTR